MNDKRVERDSELTGSGYLADPAAGVELLTAIEDQLGRVEEWLGRVRALGQPLPLGQNPVGVAMSDKLARVAADGPGSFTAALEAYRTELGATRDALAQSFDSYRSNDERHAGALLGSTGREG
jgi:hypothetical protein